MTFAITGKTEQNSLRRCVILCAFIPLQLVSWFRDVLRSRAKGFGLPSDWKVFCQGVMVHVPTWLLDPMIYFPSSGLAFLRRHVQLSNGIARRLIQSRLPESNDLDKKDALSRIGICICNHLRTLTF